MEIKPRPNWKGRSDIGRRNMEIAILRWLTDFCKICTPLNKTAFAIISKIYTNKCRIINK
jgi:hypothetical protein